MVTPNGTNGTGETGKRAGGGSHTHPRGACQKAAKQDNPAHIYGAAHIYDAEMHKQGAKTGATAPGPSTGRAKGMTWVNRPPERPTGNPKIRSSKSPEIHRIQGNRDQ